MRGGVELSSIDGKHEAPHSCAVAAVPGRTRQGFRPLPGALAAIWLSRSHSLGCERVYLTARTGPPGRAVHFREFSASRGGCIRAGSVYLISRDPSTGDLGWRTGSGAEIMRVSRRAGPQNDADCAASPVRGAAGGGRDAENSGFCTARAGVRWGGKGRPRLFMHDLSEVMQDDRAPCAGYPYWARHTPTFAASLPRRARIKRRGQLWACGRPC